MTKEVLYIPEVVLASVLLLLSSKSFPTHSPASLIPLSNCPSSFSPGQPTHSGWLHAKLPLVVMIPREDGDPCSKNSMVWLPHFPTVCYTSHFAINVQCLTSIFSHCLQTPRAEGVEAEGWKFLLTPWVNSNTNMYNETLAECLPHKSRPGFSVSPYIGEKWPGRDGFLQ